MLCIPENTGVCYRCEWEERGGGWFDQGVVVWGCNHSATWELLGSKSTELFSFSEGDLSVCSAAPQPQTVVVKYRTLASSHPGEFLFTFSTLMRQTSIEVDFYFRCTDLLGLVSACRGSVAGRCGSVAWHMAAFSLRN